MKRIVFLIYILLFLIFNLFSSAYANEPLTKVLSLNYDNSSSIICISTKGENPENKQLVEKYVQLKEPNRIYFDIENAVLIGEKKQLVFEKSDIKEIKLAQFSTEPNIVRAVIILEEDFDTSRINIHSIGDVIVVKIKPPKISNDYFNTVYTDEPLDTEYSGINVNLQSTQKTDIPINIPNTASAGLVDDIQKAFGESILTDSNNLAYNTTNVIDISSDLKLRTKYFINQYIPKNNGLLISGVGQITTSKMFYLTEPNRLVIDLPNTYLDKGIRNKEILLCPDNSCNDIAKIGQFEYNIARIVITSDKSDKYLPIYSKDMQSFFIANIEKLDHTALESNISNLANFFVKKYDAKSGEIIMSFTAPIVHSIVRANDKLNIYIFNVQSYNETILKKNISNTLFKRIGLSLLPQVGVKISLPIMKDDIIKVDESIDAKALKITYKTTYIEKPIKKDTTEIYTKGSTRNKIVIDPGHGGTDYGAIREGINEKDINFDVAQIVASILRSKGYKVVLTRTDDTFVSLEDRVSISENEKPEVFVSIHVNSATSNDPEGYETHWYHDNGKHLAEKIQRNFAKELPNANDRGLFKSKFYVINHTTAPAVLCEIGFISNDNERNELITNSRKQKTAKAISEGIIEFLRTQKR